MTHMKTNKTNEQWMDDIMDQWFNGDFDNSQGETDVDLVLQECLEALQAKDLQCQQEKVEIVESIDKANDHLSAYSRGVIGQWKQNTLKRLSSNKLS